MKRNEVTVEALKRVGYKAMVEFTSWNSHTVEECNARQSAELFDLVAKTARDGGNVKIRRQHVRGTVIAYVGRTTHQSRGAEWHYFLQRQMTEAEIMEESIRTGVWVTQ